jgi:hypothetical protein
MTGKSAVRYRGRWVWSQGTWVLSGACWLGAGQESGAGRKVREVNEAGSMGRMHVGGAVGGMERTGTVSINVPWELEDDRTDTGLQRGQVGSH